MNKLLLTATALCLLSSCASKPGHAPKVSGIAESRALSAELGTRAERQMLNDKEVLKWIESQP